MRQIYLNNNTGAIVLVHEKNSLDYSNNSSYLFLHKGTNKECLRFVDEYWDINYISEEEQVLIKD